MTEQQINHFKQRLLSERKRIEAERRVNAPGPPSLTRPSPSYSLALAQRDSWQTAGKNKPQSDLR